MVKSSKKRTVDRIFAKDAALAAFQDYQKNQLLMQSVRTTFSVSETVFNALDWLTKELKITQKEVLDVVCEFFTLAARGQAFTQYAEKIKGMYNLDLMPIQRKTIVISKKSLGIINEFVNDQGVDRNKIIETFVLGYKESFEESVKEKRKNLKCALEKIEDLKKNIINVHSEVKELLGEDNSLTRFLAVVLEYCDMDKISNRTSLFEIGEQYHFLHNTRSFRRNLEKLGGKK